MGSVSGVFLFISRNVDMTAVLGGDASVCLIKFSPFFVKILQSVDITAVLALFYPLFLEYFFSIWLYSLMLYLLCFFYFWLLILFFIFRFWFYFTIFLNKNYLIEFIFWDKVWFFCSTTDDFFTSFFRAWGIFLASNCKNKLATFLKVPH